MSKSKKTSKNLELENQETIFEESESAIYEQNNDSEHKTLIENLGDNDDQDESEHFIHGDYMEDEEESELIDRSSYPLFSVVVLCYKNKFYLKRMLDSIFFQDYPNIELIVSDDCSDDFIVEDVEEMIEDKRGDNIVQYCVYKNENNMGTVRHIDKVLKEVHGEYIIFTAADDRFANTKVFSKYVQTFADNPDSLWIVGKCNILSANFQKSIYITPTREDLPFFTSGDANKLFSRWSRRGMAIPCCMAFRPQAFEAVGGIDLEYTYLEDWPLELKLVRNGFAPAFLNEITAFHSAGGVTNSNDAYGIEVRKKFYDDKNLVYTKEVEPYLDRLTAEDRQALKDYRTEICERAYFLDIEWPSASKFGKIKLLLSKPKYFRWKFALLFEKYEKYLKKPKLILYAHILCLFSAFLLCNSTDEPFLHFAFRCLGYADFVASVLLVLTAVICIPVGRSVHKKKELRKRLVN